jgi:hypothetical protein
MHPVPVYSLSPRQIVDAMFTKHDQTTGPDLQKLRDPLLKLLPALAELETHMNLFMLASIIRSEQVQHLLLAGHPYSTVDFRRGTR